MPAVAAASLASRKRARCIDEIGFPAILRPSFTLGGSGGGIAYNQPELRSRWSQFGARPVARCTRSSSRRACSAGRSSSSRSSATRKDNAVIVCSIENLDPMGVHTGDSITVAPAMTLTDKEYQRMRDASIAIMREIGVDDRRLERAVRGRSEDRPHARHRDEPARVAVSSALASKATGFPIAKIAAKLAIGYTLDELNNDITRVTPASFEPTIDYVVVKMAALRVREVPVGRRRCSARR